MTAAAQKKREIHDVVNFISWYLLLPFPLYRSNIPTFSAVFVKGKNSHITNFYISSEQQSMRTYEHKAQKLFLHKKKEKREIWMSLCST